MKTHQSSSKLLDQLKDKLRAKHYSLRTENSYTSWVRKFILYHNKRHPRDMGPKEINAYITHLALKKHVAASTQNQALSAILFLYRKVLHQDIDPILISTAKRPDRLPIVLTRDDTLYVSGDLKGIPHLTAAIRNPKNTFKIISNSHTGEQ
ncbi:MAG: phage integrase N-terminal SAM-like domain-containing protein [Anaerolineae bacterium]|nr:phage integrase N-terminal SAM-like domain-containing protein [Anaerolineae bacterium]